MAGDNLINLRDAILIKLCPAGAEQNGLPAQTEGEHFTQQGMGMQNGLRVRGIAAGIGGDKFGQVGMHRRDDPIVNPLIGRSGGELFPGDKFAQAQRIVLGQELDHIAAGVKDQLADGVPIRLGGAKQRGGGLHQRLKLASDKVGDPVGAGEIEILFRPKVVGNCRDVLPSLRGDVAGRSVQAVFTKLGQGGGNQLTLRVFTFCCGRDSIHSVVKINQSID